MTAKEAFKYCENIARKHYENFPVGLFVPKKSRKHVYSIYAFARSADDIADNEIIPIEERIQGLKDYMLLLEECYTVSPSEAIFIALKETIKEYDIPKELLLNLLKAFMMDLEKTRYNTFEEILFYCTHSANPVGRLILILHSKADDTTFSFSDSVCTALQITNFLQDISLDILKDRIYFPLDDFKKHGYSEQDYFNKKVTPAFENILNNQIERTAALYAHGSNLIKHLKGKLKFEIILTLSGGWQILKKVKQYKASLFFDRPKLNLYDKISILIRSILKWILT